MTSLEILRLLFTTAFILWLISCVLFGRKYAETLVKAGFRHPFVVSGVWLAVSNLLDTVVYCYVLWFDYQNRDLTRAALYLIPISISTQAIAYMVIARWVMKGGAENGVH